MSIRALERFPRGPVRWARRLAFRRRARPGRRRRARHGDRQRRRRSRVSRAARLARSRHRALHARRPARRGARLGRQGRDVRGARQARALGEEAWFTLGDRDIGLHLVRDAAAAGGAPLSAVDAATSAGSGSRAAPAGHRRSGADVRDDAERGARLPDLVRGAPPCRPGARRALRGRRGGAPGAGRARGDRAAPTRSILAPSNPFVSIQPILAVPGIAEPRSPGTRVVAVSPLVGGQAAAGAAGGDDGVARPRAGRVGVAALYAGLATVRARSDPRSRRRGARPAPSSRRP